MKRPLIAAACAALVAAGCGDDADSSQGKQVADTVRDFALADGPDACDLLGGQALTDNYGGDNYTEGKQRCERAAGDFQGEPVTIKLVKITSDTTARVNAESKAGRLYVVSLSKPEGKWLIERISQQRR